MSFSSQQLVENSSLRVTSLFLVLSFLKQHFTRKLRYYRYIMENEKAGDYAAVSLVFIQNVVFRFIS